MMSDGTGHQFVLSDEMLERFAGRTSTYDRENRFFTEDFQELKEVGYLLLTVPQELGGLGLNHLEGCREQRRLAYHAPATALAVNMHLEVTAMAADLYRAGDTSCNWLLEEAVQGEVFGLGRTDAGNDMPVLYSTTRAEPTQGGYRFYGHKMFGSLSPVWTRLGIYGQDNTDPANPKMVHAFFPRDTPGYTIKETWDTLGMRATRSDDTLLDGLFVPDRMIPRVIPVGLAGADLFILAIFAWAEPSFGSIYLGIADRARDLAVAAAHQRTSVAYGGRSMAYNPMVQYAAAEMTIALEAATATIDRVTQDWSTRVDHGGAWASKLVAAKYIAVEAAQKVVDLAMDMTGGAGFFRSHEMERLYRDVRAGKLHPANSGLVHEMVGKTTLGILGEEPRWG
jgi:alkylation response protein AidB-like acyl-CoA dehydrogenase